MPDISAAHFVRYAGTSNLTDLACPPYDIIDEAGRAALEAKSPHNYVRLILPHEQPGDGPLDRYRRARQLLDKWMAEGVLAQDKDASIFAVEQTFADPLTGQQRVRRGIQSLVKLHEFSEGIILPHERTLSGPKADRLELMKAVRAHLSPIFILYADEKNEVLGSDLFQGPPAITAEAAGATHRAWRVTDPNLIIRLKHALGPRKGYIADGHHRYETALGFRALARAEGKKVEGTALDYIPAFLCGMSDPGLVIFPTHRLVHSMPADLSLLDRAREFFRVETLPAALTDATLPAALKKLGHAGDSAISFLVADAQGKAALMSLRPDAPLEKVKSLPSAPSLRTLDVSVLHAVVFEHILGMSRESQEKQQHLRYEKDAKASIARVRGGEASLAFLLNATKMEQVRKVSEAGEVMPQKSTYFFPKIIDGLELNLLDGHP